VTPFVRPAPPCGLEQLITRTARAYRLGRPDAHEVIGVGYEDCNVRLATDTGAYVVKVFGPSRRAVAVRTGQIIAAVVRAGVAHPGLHVDRRSAVVHVDPTGNAVIVMDLVGGGSLFDLRRPPCRRELSAVVAEAAKIHTVSLEPEFVYDAWAIPNLPILARHLQTVLSPEDRTAVRVAVDAYETVERPRLAHALIHGDLTKGNVLTTGDGVLLIDYGVANRAPRIQELAVVAANLMHGEALDLGARARLLVDLYSAHQVLSPQEIDALPAYTLAAAAMEYLGALNARLSGVDSDETAYLVELGREALHSGMDSLGVR
jgi:Ser/Thr protein kinase RdoA (MazF antagonist)